MKMSFLKRISSIPLFFLFIFGLNVSSFGQSLDPLETQPSDFGEIKRSIEPPKESIHQNRNEPQKPVLSEMEAFVAQAKQGVIETPEIRSAERQ